jgi:hypothetical protein
MRGRIEAVERPARPAWDWDRFSGVTPLGWVALGLAAEYLERSRSSCPRSHCCPRSIGNPHRAHGTKPVATSGAKISLRR